MGSTLYVGHAAPPTQYKAFITFLLTGCLKAQLRDTPARSSSFQGQDTFPVIVSTVEVEQRSIKMTLSYNVHILSSEGFSLNWFN